MNNLYVLLIMCLMYLFALCTLKSHGLQPTEIPSGSENDLSGLTTVCLLAWWGFTDAVVRSRLEAGLRHMGYLPEDFPCFIELACSSVAGLFKSISSNPDHVL